ncbi:Transmembrane protein 53 [Colletotrichum tanaceti]|uniref:Transmembrane protein 53 n=1 Tax=Colletotrichum tanaceti TaxID=1306861 RepID=A0A4U6XMB3_9PEZI|nr:Transmembrane protein 53 [Colletotrichum tanaceti]TKW56815.1 Transmembrane protein 53 [Colletotrichum tanaceti]
MASNQPAGAAGPLPAMQELSPTTFLYDPPSAVLDANSPKLIVVFSWMSAQDVHIAKYTSRYMALYPSASILLVKCPFIHTLSTRISKRQIKPAVPVVRSLADAAGAAAFTGGGGGGGGQPPQLLFHVFSNGGATNYAKFLELYSEADRAGRLALPPHVTLYDSCPGGFHWMRSYRALSASMPRVLSPLAHVFIGWFWLFHVPLGRVGFFGKMWAALRQKALLGSEKRRAYLYSKEDEMIHWADVERHADEAKENGFDVRKERFDGSQHVAHAKLNPSRYWGVVREMWDAGPKTVEPAPKGAEDAAEDAAPEPPKTAPAPESESPQVASASPIATLEPDTPKVELTSPKAVTEPDVSKASPTPAVVPAPAPAPALAPPVPAPEPVKAAPEPEAPTAAPPPPEVKKPKRSPTPPPTIQ